MSEEAFPRARQRTTRAPRLGSKEPQPVQLSYRIGQRYVSQLIKVQPFTKSELGARLRRIEQKYGREH